MLGSIWYQRISLKSFNAKVYPEQLSLGVNPCCHGHGHECRIVSFSAMVVASCVAVVDFPVRQAMSLQVVHRIAALSSTSPVWGHPELITTLLNLPVCSGAYHRQAHSWCGQLVPLFSLGARLFQRLQMRNWSSRIRPGVASTTTIEAHVHGTGHC